MLEIIKFFAVVTYMMAGVAIAVAIPACIAMFIFSVIF